MLIACSVLLCLKVVELLVDFRSDLHHGLCNNVTSLSLLLLLSGFHLVENILLLQFLLLQGCVL